MMENNSGKNLQELRWFALVGDNGMGFTSSEGVVIEGIQKLRNVTIFQMPSAEAAKNYAYAAYISRFMMRNYALGVNPLVPVNLPADCIFYDQDFAKREGNATLSYFAGLLL